MTTLAEPLRRSAAHWELVRALGAFALTPPPGNDKVSRALGLDPPTGSEHTEVFVLAAPPHAAIHLGAEGQLGGEALDVVAGFWRALGLRAPEDADHLGALLMLYAELGSAEQAGDDERRAAQLRRSREALFHEHLWSWAPGYLDAVARLRRGSVAEWAELVQQVLREEVAGPPEPAMLPLALRTAPSALDRDGTREELLDALVSPVRSGMLLTQRDLQIGADTAGVGVRRGERRYVLRAMLEQDPRATLGWLSAHAHECSRLHALRGSDATRAWWRDRAAHTAVELQSLLVQATAGDEAV